MIIVGHKLGWADAPCPHKLNSVEIRERMGEGGAVRREKEKET